MTWGGKKELLGQRESAGAQGSGKSVKVAGAMDQWSSKTPEKPMQQRGRNRGVALSVKDVRRAAKGMRDSDLDRTRPGSGIRSTKRQILLSPERKKPMVVDVDVDVDVSTSSSNLPEKYEMLCETFHSLDCVVRLMRMKGVTPSFSNVCSKVQQLTDRRFTYEQLAQVKFMLPEVLVLKKVSVLDEATNCMKYDIHISFELDAIKPDRKAKGGGGRVQLSKVFRSRLLDFLKSHSEDTEIPEGPLPEPFGRPSEGSSQCTFYPPPNSSASADPVTDHILEEKITASHLSHSFRKRFSKKIETQEEASTNQSNYSNTLELAVSKEEIDANVAPSPMESSMEVVAHCDSESVPVAAPRSSSPSLLATPSKPTTLLDSRRIIEMTPSKFDSIPASLMTSTPAPIIKKRSLMSRGDDDSSKTSNKLVRRALLSRSLKFETPVKDTKVEDDKVIEASCSSIDSELVDILDKDLVQSIMEKEQKAREENDPAISQAKRRRDMIAGLPKLFNKVHFYFRSIKRAVVTKEELMHNMITSHSDYLDRREVEEQLKLLQELAPEYISESIALSGDCLLRVNKVSDVECIRARLAEAK